MSFPLYCVMSLFKANSNIAICRYDIVDLRHFLTQFMMFGVVADFRSGVTRHCALGRRVVYVIQYSTGCSTSTEKHTIYAWLGARGPLLTLDSLGFYPPLLTYFLPSFGPSAFRTTLQSQHVVVLRKWIRLMLMPPPTKLCRRNGRHLENALAKLRTELESALHSTQFILHPN